MVARPRRRPRPRNREGNQTSTRTRTGCGTGPTPTCLLAVRNHQRIRRLDLRLLRKVAQALLRETWQRGSYDLAIHVVAAPEITRLNETFLQHKGSTDVITFDYSESAALTAKSDRQHACSALLHGEIFVCMDEAMSQASRFHVTWESELVRYIVHGVLHLLGYDDHASHARRKMKQAEDALVRELASQFDFRRLER